LKNVRKHGSKVMRDSKSLMSKARLQVLSVVVLLTMLGTLPSCGGASSAPFDGAQLLGNVAVSVAPQTMSVTTGSTQAFTATVSNSGMSSVQWQVNGIPGGQGSIGTIDGSGNYTAPQFVPNPPNVTVTAIADADNTKSGNATVSITGAQTPATVAISPTTASLQVGTNLSLAASVTGPTDTTVTWQVNDITNGNASVGAIVPGTGNTAIYTAPAAVPSGGTVTIKALSHAQPNVSASCVVTISLQPPNIATVTISPLTANVQVSSSFTFTATVIGVTDTSMTWQVAGTAGGYSTVGTISQTGIYTAPSSVPTPNTVTVTAVSNAQPAKSASATVTITPPAVNAVAITISPTSANVNTDAEAQFQATVTNAQEQTVTWQVNGISGGNATYGTITPVQGQLDLAEYAAPASVPANNPVIVSVIPTAAPNISATAAVTITQPNVKVTVTTPTGASSAVVQINQTQVFDAAVTGAGGSQDVNWYVNGVLGGNGQVGTVTNTASNVTTYTAPAAVPNPAAVQIKAVSTFDLNAFGTAGVTVVSAPTVTISPSLAQVQETLSQNLSATVTGIPNPSLTWYANGEAWGDPVNNGTITLLDSTTLNAQYEAPPTIPPSPNNPVIITAIDLSGAVSNSASMTVIPLVQAVTISVDPTTATIMPAQIQTFTATVNNSSDQIVNWSLSGPSGGCTATICGTITLQTNGAPATYTAPATIPSDPNITVTATADASPNPQATAALTIAILPASISISPANPTLQAGTTGITTFVANVQNVDPTTTEVTWTLGCDSQAPSGENCFDFSSDGAGPGCLSDGLGNERCDTGSIDDFATVNLSYTPPKILGSSFVENACTSASGTNGMVPLTASFSASNCSPTGICTASVCITVTPTSENDLTSDRH
jgi:hypothetical protein